MSRLRKQPTIAAVVAGAMLAALTTTATAQLQLNVSPFSGAVSVQNTSASPASLDGYQITSASGQLIPDPTNTPGVGWDSLTDAGTLGFAEFVPSKNALSELNISSSKSIPAGASVNLGYASTAYSTRDLVWGYSVAGSGGASVSSEPGTLHYGGGATVEVITLHGAGNSIYSIPVILHNVETTVGVTFDAYVISSLSGSLNPAGFNGFAGHSKPGWGSFAPSTNALSELNLTVTPTMAADNYQALGLAFKTDGTKDLTLEIHAIGPTFGDDAFAGDVVYKTQLAGDTTHDGIVDISDIQLIAAHYLQTTLPGEANYDGLVDVSDIQVIAANYLNSAGGGGGGVAAVPEPASLGLMVVGLALGLCHVRRARRGK